MAKVFLVVGIFMDESTDLDKAYALKHKADARAKYINDNRLRPLLIEYEVMPIEFEEN